ncbi:hypothetical protein [Rathayibacter tritici]|uniref:Uncharacterized protein n=1 Tax=Rathayibacter tritici TaxID=33888 RepID=A0A160KQA6_9MICO|nr:hypothetical protein [Rathayibacter tritici]AND15339.1 hypothetical protein A6122_0174 [Rathayibacter tritici]PPF27960.1 hypothetical protein C5C06_08655 [Rathayibacter tritici]PPI18977.1 hypothetical protein C5D07_02650 [Rathayibacter tritici]PPI47825.1 hypothetical protein C5D18_02650 [Rathayibacter tritici]
MTTSELNRAVAAALFGDSSRAIGSPKELEAEGSFVWGDYPVEAFYYAAWILYRVDRFFARTPESSTLKAARYHIAMMVSALINPEIVPIFESANLDDASKRLKMPKKLTYVVSVQAFAEKIESAIVTAVQLATEQFQVVLDEGRSLRKDDVRSRRSQEALLQRAKSLSANS